MPNTTEELYQILIESYRDIWDRVKTLDALAQRRQDEKLFSRLAELDKQRNIIHDKLRSLAPFLEKTSFDITVDILASNNLSEFQLPEFKILPTKSALPCSEIRVFDVDDREIFYQNNCEIGQTKPKEVPENFYAFIPFGQSEYLHIFDFDTYRFRHPEELELRRRIQRLCELSKHTVAKIEIRSSTSFHLGLQLFGIAFSSDKLDVITALLREHRAELSCKKEFLPTETLRADFRFILKEDFARICTTQLSPQERTRQELIDRLVATLEEGKLLDPQYKDILHEAAAWANEKSRELEAVAAEKALDKQLELEQAQIDAVEARSRRVVPGRK